MGERKYSNTSLISVPITLMFDDKILAHATACFYLHETKYYLITNWHNVSGIHPETKTPLSNHAGKPNSITFPLIKDLEPEVIWEMYQLPLYRDSSMDCPGWYIHPLFKEKVDVIAIEVNIPFNQKCMPVNDPSYKFRFQKFEVADEIFILGFPNNIKTSGMFPIWKKASIASEPNFDFEGKPVMLVDTASRQGMSGSPVILRRGTAFAYHGEIGSYQSFVGIYSGRIQGKTEFEAQLGLVWKKQVIEEIIVGKTFDEIS